ncbi:hypothetical protein ACHHYP_08318 [Achlya hypogyna]|uniref:Uncharacterized protein n=1 Tax=Achlya hypogyna TaxID=1202772 RepID=A0A1V9ZKP3_ACHHY|nr:hypothetical protein ACHHYP_08318 [Achlya hypogyna]
MALNQAEEAGDDSTSSASAIPETDAVFPAPSSCIANLNKQLRELETRYHRTRVQLEKTTLKVRKGVIRCLSPAQSDAMAAEVRKMRQEHKSLEKELAKKSLLLERLASDKKQIEAQAIANRDYAKRIEQKLAMGAKGQAAATRHAEMVTRIQDLDKQRHENLATLEAKDDQIKDLSAKISILKRSLDLRIRELGLDGNLHNGIIFEIARLQEANTSLALQLALEVDQSVTLKNIIAEKDTEITELECARIDAERQVARQESAVADVQKLLEAAKTDVAALQDEKQMLLGYVQDQAVKLLRGEAAMKRQAQSHKQALEAVELELQRRTNTIAEMTQKAAEAQAGYDKLMQAYSVTQETITHERSSSEALRELLEEKTSQLDATMAELRTVQEESDARALHQGALESTCAAQGASLAQLQQQIEELAQRCAGLEEQNRAQAASTRALQDEMERSLVDLESVTRERNEAARAMNEAVTISATAMDEQQLLQEKVEAQATQIDRLKQSKALLQNAMLEQLAALRKQLQLERVARMTAEAKLSRPPGPPPPPEPSSPAPEAPPVAPKSPLPPRPPSPARVHRPYILLEPEPTITLEDLIH